MPTPAFKPIVFSYTMLNCYDSICPYQMFRRFVKKDIPFTETEAMRKGNEIHSAMEYRIGGKPLPYEMQHWEPFVAPIVERGAKAEVKLGITAEGRPTGFFDKDVWCRGKADVVIIANNNAFLVDWKSGGSKYENAFEIALQGLMVKAANPHVVKIAGCYAWLGENRLGTIHDLSDVSSTWTKVNNIAEQIKDDMASGEWEKRKGPLCGYCPCEDCKHHHVARPK